MKKIIYLDNASTTQVDKSVLKTMEYYNREEYGNPSSIHKMGEKAKNALNNARGAIAKELGCRINEIIFTSGATESNNLAFFGLAKSELGKKKKKIIISSIEHSSVFEICNELKNYGFNIKEIGVDNEGYLNLSELENEINEDTLLVSIIHANNEIGVIQDIAKIGKLCRDKNIFFHSDCAQSFGKEVINVKNSNIDILSAGAHKFGGPKGIGFIFVRESIKLKPIVYGGGQERGLRGGTESVALAVGMSKALDLSKMTDWKKIASLRDYFISGLERSGGKINGGKKHRIANNINVRFENIDGEATILKLSLKGIMCSTGSACDNIKKTENRVLKSIGLNEEEIKESIRFGLSVKINKKDIDYVLKEIKEIVKR